jgi:hypothetical protein
MLPLLALPVHYSGHCSLPALDVLLTCSTGSFNDEYTVQQAPASTFKVPIESDKIAIFAVSERYPTYYDLCVADAAYKTSCYNARGSFTGMAHSGDINEGTDLLHHIKLSEKLHSGKEFVVFVSGFQCRFGGTPFHDSFVRRCPISSGTILTKQIANSTTT